MLTDRSWRFVAKQQDLEFYEHLLPPEHPLDDALRLIPWESFTPLLESYYSPGVGQPAIPPLLFLKLEFLRYFHRLSDREVISRAVTDAAFRWFLQIPVACTLPHPTSLVYFRGRLGVEGFNKIFDQLVTLARQAGLIRDRLRLKDASHVIANIAVPSTRMLLAQLRERMLDEVRKIDSIVATGFEIELDLIRKQTVNEEGDIQLQRRVELLQQILAFLQSQPTPADSDSDPVWLQRKRICDLASKILDDTAHPGNGDRILSLVDPDARRGRHGQWYDGYSIDISMDADSNLITAVDVLVAGGDEAKSAVNLIKSEHEAQGNQVENLSIDGVGFNGPMLRELESPEGLNVKVFTPTREAGSKELVSVHEFPLSGDGKSVTCPAGQRSSTYQRDAKRHRTYFQFRRDTCVGCALLAKCKPTLGDGVYGGRGVTKNDYEAEHERARARTKTEAYAAVRREHPAIERKLNEVMNQQGARHAKYWGKQKTTAQALMTCFTVNVKRIGKLLIGKSCAPAP
jgi:transposase